MRAVASIHWFRRSRALASGEWSPDLSSSESDREHLRFLGERSDVSDSELSFYETQSNILFARGANGMSFHSFSGPTIQHPLHHSLELTSFISCPVNVRAHKYWPTVLRTCAVSQHISGITAFIAVFVHLYSGALAPDRLMMWDAGAFAVGYVAWDVMAIGAGRSEGGRKRRRLG